MLSDNIDSGLELIVLEGNGQGEQHPLLSTNVELGRWETNDVLNPERIGFAEPTVSRLHAELEWNPERQSYLLIHRSRTNATIVNGNPVGDHQMILPGDKVQMGHLVCQLCKRETQAMLESPQHLLILSGPDKGTSTALHTFPVVLKSRYYTLGQNRGEIPLTGLGESQLLLSLADGKIRVRQVQGEELSRVVDSWSGVIRETVLSGDDNPVLEQGTLLRASSLALMLVPAADVQSLGQTILAGGQAHPLLELGEIPAEYRLRVLSGEHVGSLLWIDPGGLETALRLGPAGSALAISGGASAEVRWTEQGPVLRNSDARQQIGFNWTELEPGAQRPLVSGDRFQIGNCVVRYECLAVQAQLDRLSLRFQDEEVPFHREVSLLGSSSTSDFFLNEDLLGSEHASLRVTAAGEVYYRQMHEGAAARVGSQSVAPGQEVRLQIGQPVTLAQGIEMQILRDGEGHYVEPTLVPMEMPFEPEAAPIAPPPVPVAAPVVLPTAPVAPPPAPITAEPEPVAAPPTPMTAEPEPVAASPAPVVGPPAGAEEAGGVFLRPQRKLNRGKARE